MSEGGFLPWKAQRINTSRGPAGNYSNIRYQLPDVPKGMKWVKNEKTREWSVVPDIEDAIIVEDAVMAKTQDDIPMDAEGTVQDAIRVQSDNEAVRKAVASYSIGSNSCDLVFVEHRVESTDTFAGLCLKYSVSPTALRQINQFSGSNLQLAPDILLIPTSTGKNSKLTPRMNEPKKDYKIREFMVGCGAGISRNEAKSYLEMNDNDVQLAIENYKEDTEWDCQQGSNYRNQFVLNNEDEKPKRKSFCTTHISQIMNKKDISDKKKTFSFPTFKK